MISMNLIETKDLSKKFDNKVILDKINIKIPSGKIVGLLGKNGAGKSTLIKLINDLLTPTSGEILIKGNKVGVESKKVISYLPERNIPLRFIELMPLSCNSELQGLSGETIRKMFGEAGIKLLEEKALLGNGPAVYYRAEGYAGAIGFIEPLHNKFCDSCNRIRLTATGLLPTIV